MLAKTGHMFIILELACASHVTHGYEVQLNVFLKWEN